MLRKTCAGKKNSNWIRMQKNNFNNKTLRVFGIIMGTVLFVISAVFFLLNEYSSAAIILACSCLLSVSGLFLPFLLKPVYIGWMHIAFVLAWINTRIILILMFYLIFTPTGLLMKLFSVNSIKRKKAVDTYWKRKDAEFNPSTYERRF